MTTDSGKPAILFINDVRIARVSLTQPYIGKDAPINPQTGKPEGKYHVDAILDETHPQLVAFKALMRAAVEKKFGDQAPVMLEQIVANNKLALHRGNVDRAGKPEYANKLYISASNADQPNIVVTDESGVNIATQGTPILLTPAHPLYPYAGCYANIAVSCFAYSHPKGGKGVSAQLMGVQFLRHGEKLRGASVVGANEFGLVAKAADAAPPVAGAKGSEGLI